MSRLKRNLRQRLLGGAPHKIPADAARARTATPFVIETMEPRLLLSSIAGLQAIHDNLANMETLIGGADMAGPLSHTYELVSANGATTAGNIANLKSNFDSDIVSALAGEISSLGTATTVPAAQLQSDLQSAIGSIVGTGSGDSASVTVTDNNTVTEIDFHITQVQTGSFTSNFGTIGTHDGISLPIATGNTLTITTAFSLDVTIADNLVASPTPAQEETAFNLKAGATFDLTIAATSNLANAPIDVGIMTLTVDPSAAPISESAAFHGAFVALTGMQLAADATAITGGNDTSLTGATPDLAVTQGATTNATIDIPLDLTANEVIPGITTFTGANLVFSGHAVGTDQTGSDLALATAFQTATADSSFALSSLNTFLPGDLATELGKLGDAINSISDFSAVDVPIPFTDGTTIASVIDVATAFNTLLIAPLSSTVGAIGFTEGQANGSSANFVEGTALSAADLANLPQTVAVQLTLTQPVQGSTSLATQTTSLEFAPTYTNSSGQTEAISTVDNLVTALNAAITASPLAGYVLASNDNNKVDFVLQTPPSGSTPATADTAIAVSSPHGVSLFSNVRSFGIQLATLLQLPGYNDTTDDATTVGNQLLGELGLGYDAADNAITFTISHEFDLPALSIPASFDLNLGSVADLALKNGHFSLVPEVLLNLTVGLSLNPLGSDVNQPGGPVIGDGSNGTTDVALSAIPVVGNASENGTQPLTADAIAAAAGATPDTGLADLQIISRLGEVASITIDPGWTLSNLENAIATAFADDPLTVTYNGTGNHEIDIADNATGYAGPSPASVGLTAGTQAVAAQVAGADQYDYVATLPGTAFSTSNAADFGQATKFILTLGSLAPFVVDVPAGTSSAASFVTALNAALGAIDVSRTELGLAAGSTLPLSQLVQASVDSDGGVALSTSVYNALHGALGHDPTTTAQQAEVQWGLSVSPLELTISRLNGSMMGDVLGITGTDINGGTSTQGLIVGAALDGETLADRLELINTGISATITAALTPTNAGDQITVSGALGPLDFTGTVNQAYISLEAALLLDNPANPGSDTLTLHQFDTALANNSFASIFSFQLLSGMAGQPYADLDIGNIMLMAAGITLTTAASPEIIITLDDPSGLLSLQTPSPMVVVNGYSPALAAADVVGALQQVFNNLDSGLADATIPLINVSLDQVLNFSSQMLVAFDAAGAAGTFSLVQNDINVALGGHYVTITENSSDDLIISLEYTPVAVQTTLPFNLDLSQLASFTGNSTLQALANDIASVTSASASGDINVTAGVSLALTLGINIGANNQPAALTDLLSSLNDKKGLTTGTAGETDLQVNFANGKSFQVDVGALPSTATVQDLLNLLNTAASGVGVSTFASYNATTGALTLTDPTEYAPDGLSDLGLSNATGATTADGYTLTGDAPLSATKAGAAYAFNLSIGNDVTAQVDVAADSARTTVEALAGAIQTALDQTLIAAKSLLLENGNLPGGGLSSSTHALVPLGELVDVSVVDGNLVFFAPMDVLGRSGNSVLNTLTVSAVTPQSTFSVESINGSHIAQGLGLGSDTDMVTDMAASRSLTGALTEPGTSGQRFFVETGTGSNGALLTGVTATIGISATNLDFSAGIGPLSATITDGSAVLGADTGGMAAGSAGFAVGAPSTAPATFSIGLNDNFAGETTPGILTFADLAKLGSGGTDTLANLLSLTYDAALSVNLPVQVIGQNLGPITLQIGNLFNDPGLPMVRSVNDTFPSLSGISLPSILNNPQAVIDGLDGFFSILSGGSFAQGLYGLNLPLIGTALHGIGSFFSSLHNDVVGTLQSDLNAFIAAHPGQPATTQNIVTQGLQGALNELGIGGTVESYIDNIAQPTEIAFVFQFSDTLFSSSVDLTANLGIPGLGINIANGVATVAATLDATIGFGYKSGVGFFVFDEGTPNALTSFTPNNLPNLPPIDFATTPALALQVSVTLASGFTANVSLGILSAKAVNGTSIGADGVAGTNLTGQLIANIGPDDPASDHGLLPFSSFGSSTVQAYFNASLNIDLILTAGIGTTTPSLSLPNITTEVMFAYGYAKALLGALPDGIASGVTTPLTFMNVSLDLGSFLSNFLKPILDDVEKVIGPLQPILDFLNAPIPGISQIIGPTSILDLADDLGTPGIQEAVHFIDVLTEISDIAATLDALAHTPHSLMLDFGNYVLGPLTSAQQADASYHSLESGTVDPFKTPVSSMTPAATSAAEMNMFSAMAASSLNGLPGGSSLNTLQNDTSGSGGKPVISFPILHDPLALVEMLMGDITPVSLIQVTLPPFGFTFSKDYAFHFLIGPVPVEVDFFASVGVSINLTFGFDTSGIIRFESSDNPLDIFDGFYILTNAGPELTFTATFGVNAGIDLELVAAGLGGEITGTVSFSLNDPNANGHLYASDLLHELENNPLDLFSITGELDAKIYAWYWVGIDLIFGKVTLVQGQITILDETLLSFSYDYAAAHSTPILATPNGSTLSLNMGVDADEQENGANTTNQDQSFTVTGDGSDDGSVSVAANGGSAQSYTGASTISADLGSGNNKVIFRNVGENVSITGGDGNDMVNLGGVSGDPVVTLGDGNNMIYGATTDTTVTVGNGNNIIYAGTGRMTINAGDGNNTIIGGTASDIIVVGDGNNTIEGGSAGNIINAGGGSNTIYGGGGSNVISITGGAGNNVIFGSGGPSDTVITATTVSDTDSSNEDGNNTITGGDGNDIIFGGNGNNTITAGAGNAVVFGATGTLTRTVDGAVVTAMDDSTLGGNDVINGGAGDTYIIGGAGANTISTGSGNDVVLGNDGTIEGAAGGANNQFTITGLDGVGGNDTITTGVGADVVIAGHGANTIIGGTGSDVILGHEGIVVRTAALGDTAAVLSVQTTDTGSGGNDLIVTGTGTDIVLGGAGNNTIHAGSEVGTSGVYQGAGLDILIGGFGTVTATVPGAGIGAVNQSFVVTGTDGEDAGHGNDTITTDNTAIIMGGGGNNIITTDEGPLASVVMFGANGEVTFDTLLAGGIKVHTAGTVSGEEKIGGHDTITAGQGSDEIFGGAGNSTITAGNGNDVILGHLGAYNADRLAAPNSSGIAPDVLGFYQAQDGTALNSTGDVISAGNGNDVIMGGAGNNSITAGSGSDIVFGAAGDVTRNGPGNDALLVAQTTEESLGGNDTITVGLNSLGSDVVFGGAGHNVITAGNGSDIILGHLGEVNLANFDDATLRRSTGQRPDILGRTLPEIGVQVSGEPQVSGLDRQLANAGATIIAGNGNNVIMGGAGSNTITAGNGSNTVFGASGAVTRDATSLAVMFATTVEEQYGGNNNITLASGDNTVFGGIGNNIISVGNRTNVIFGHLGEVDMYATTLYTAAQRAQGALPDLIGRYLPEIGNLAPTTPAGLAGLDEPISNTTSTITAGNGNDVIFGGAGNNTIEAGLGLDVVFGAAGAVTRAAGTLSPVFMETTEESYGGKNTIDLGLRSTSGDVVFGGIGSNNIEVGNGNNIVLGHLGTVDLSNLLDYTSVQRDAGNLPDIWARVVPEIGNVAPVSAGGSERLNTIALTGNDTILAGNGNDVVMGGGGNNTITTGAGVDVVFGAAGSVSRDARSLRVMYATTVEESLGGNDTLNIGNGARNNDTVFGGAGNDRINLGSGNNVAFGHLGRVDLYAIDGIGQQGADLLGRTIPVIANVGPVSTGPWAGLGHKLATSGDTIIAGNGNNIIEGGAGNNTLQVGNGNNVLVGASASITRNPTTLQEIAYTKTEIGLGGTNTYIHGTGTDLIVNDPIPNNSHPQASPAATQERAVPVVPVSDTPITHAAPATAAQPAAKDRMVHVVSGSQTLASGNDLLQLAMALQATPAATAQAAAYVLDDATGQWIADDDDGAEPLLVGLANRPELLLTPGQKARHAVAAAA